MTQGRLFLYQGNYPVAALRQLLWHRHRMVQARTRIMNQLQAVALNEGLRCKKRLWRERGRQQLESFRLAPWASRRRRDLLELLDRLNPTIAELSQTIEREVEKCPDFFASYDILQESFGISRPLMIS